MNKESFLETIRQQYSDEIHEAYIECEHGNKVDLVQLNQRLARLMTHAKVEGLSVADFHELVVSTLPAYADQVDYQGVRKAG
jgi:hypothetical protein